MSSVDELFLFNQLVAFLTSLSPKDSKDYIAISEALFRTKHKILLEEASLGQKLVDARREWRSIRRDTINRFGTAGRGPQQTLGFSKVTLGTFLPDFLD